MYIIIFEIISIDYNVFQENDTSSVPSTSRVQELIKSENTNEDLSSTEIKCKGCLKNFSIKAIQHHLKNNASCQNIYSQKETDELKTQCNLYRKGYLAHWYKENKVAKSVRQPGEIETIIQAMKKIRKFSFYRCMWKMADDLKSHVYMLRKMKPYFSNQSHVEEDIQEFIQATLSYFDDEYDYTMKEIVWSMDFLLSNTSLSIDEEVENLERYLTSMEWHIDSYSNIPSYNYELYDLYFQNLLKQLPEVSELNEGGSARDYFEEIGIEGPEKILVKDYFELKYGEYTDDEELKDLPDDWLYPFKDPDLLHYDDFEDEFTLFLQTLCRGCGKKFKVILQHLIKPEVICSKYYEQDEMKSLKHNSKVQPQKSKILVGDEIEKQRKYSEFLHGIIKQNFNVRSSTRLEVYRGKRDWSEFLAIHAVPDYLMERHQQKIKEAFEIHDNLDEEICHVKFQVLEELGPSNTWASENHYLDSQFIINMGKNLRIYIWNEKMKTALFLWDTLEYIALKIGSTLKQIFSTNSYGHRHFDFQYRLTNEQILNKNQSRYDTSKQGLVDSFRKKEKWKGTLNFDTMIYHSDYSTSFKK